ncbi:hypothetical protein EJ070_31710 [Mesorhizobium sp. M1E.F.Ca.ET.045.02.1.1]|uniref:hypothetical protein n=1 Tax=Mesorhizobium sp. M1E.F.Ca.ET.045.02.1.1 TaxID=2493672 RepID=UPI000F76564D|nr:hypothetical protein [Mesorhizobium sp. M1E.F.Ca.ET.045.02.1.1]AZO24785.1 hypothetical protein EJ070_31710 [Mesorhizobium sp. M1E.F.Ca.ET.045.02.1.1]
MQADNEKIHFLSDRDQRGRFAIGRSKGRPVGAKGRVNRELLQQVKALGPDAINKLKDALDKGQQWAIELVLKHVLPKDGRTLEFEDATPDDLREAFRNGDISMSEFKLAADAIGKLADVDTIEELQARLAELERLINGAPQP